MGSASVSASASSSETAAVGDGRGSLPYGGSTGLVTNSPGRRAEIPAQQGSASEGLRIADVTLDLSEDGRTAVIELTAHAPVSDASIRVGSHRGGVSAHIGTAPLGDLQAGQSVQRSMELPEFAEGDTGILAQVFTGPDGADSQFIAVRNGSHGIVTAISFEGLAEAELQQKLKLGLLSEDEFQAEALKLHAVPAADPSSIKVAPLPDENQSLTAAADQVTISGTVTYLDRNGIKRPVRNARLELVSTSGLPGHEIGRTSGTGTFNATVVDFRAGEYMLKVVTDNEVGVIHTGNDSNPYYVASGPYRWSPGNAYSSVNVDIANNTDTGRSFALLDALRTVGAHYQSIRRSDWQSKLLVIYPATGSRMSGGVIYTGGSSLICSSGGDHCNEDAFDWTVLAHEAGHVVADEEASSPAPEEATVSVTTPGRAAGRNKTPSASPGAKAGLRSTGCRRCRRRECRRASRITPRRFTTTARSRPRTRRRSCSSTTSRRRTRPAAPAPSPARRPVRTANWPFNECCGTSTTPKSMPTPERRPPGGR
nr:hypothetical protein GCM10020093_094630 [Planobispora longispora]